MADPTRYFIDAHMDCDGDLSMARLIVTRSAAGDWVKWSDFKDYKAAQKRNKSEDSVMKLGLECVELRVRIEDLEKEVEALTQKITSLTPKK